MTRKCSHCSHNGHNSRTCPNKGVKLFGVRLTDGSSSIRKSVSMGNLSHYAAAAGGGASPADGGDHGPDVADGYASEDFVAGSSSGSRERKRGVPWTEEEHRMFLLGLQKLGKGDWRGIARTFVKTRTPTQVASHAQKFFIRQTNMGRRKRRSSLFDIVPDEAGDSQFLPMTDQETELIINSSATVPQTVDEECESMDSNNSLDGESNAPKQDPTPPPPQQSVYPFIYPAFFTPVLPYPVPIWTTGFNSTEPEPAETRKHEVVKPIPVHSKTPINVDELLGMSSLSIDESNADAPCTLTRTLIGDSSRQSAFHAKSGAVKSGASGIRAVQ